MNKIIWLTGLPCSGKTPIAQELSRHLKAEILDGDDLRSIIDNYDFTPEGRRKHMLMVAELAYRFSKYTNVIVALVSPLKLIRDEIKNKYSNLIEIFVSCPVEECIKRDVKGMYKKAISGEVKEFTGISAPYEEPTGAFIVDTLNLSVNESVNSILKEYFKPETYSIFIGRYQPLHQGHIKLINKVLEEGKKVCVALRDTPIDENNPYSIEEREGMFKEEFGDKVKVITIPNVEDVCYGRKVGWGMREIRLDSETEKISATKIRKGL